MFDMQGYLLPVFQHLLRAAAEGLDKRASFDDDIHDKIHHRDEYDSARARVRALYVLSVFLFSDHYIIVAVPAAEAVVSAFPFDDEIFFPVK
ncbi:hypothetical protein SAMN02910317_03089 [Ruminococcaceae bacterium FB2012]|nr:hypothetical protein SAMN02910317_03089 [Ruminococcaceae bacterium FB2012]